MGSFQGSGSPRTECEGRINVFQEDSHKDPHKR